MEHGKIRRKIAAGEVTEEVRRHLAGCPACAAFAERVELVRAEAPALVGAAPPAGLAERVIERVRTEGRGDGLPAVVPPIPLRGRLRRFRTPLMAAAAVAAVAALVAGLLVAGPGGPEPAEALALAAERTAALDTARLTLEGEARVHVRLPEISLPTPPPMGATVPSLPPLPDPDLGGVPEELRGEIRERFDEARRRAEVQQRLAAQELDGGLRERFDAARDALPGEFETTATFEGTGAIALPDRLRVVGTVKQAHGVRPDAPRTSDYEVVVVGDEAWIRNPDGTWSRIPGVAGPFGPLVLDPEAVARFVGAAEGAEEIGTETLDGVEVRHYRFRVPSVAFGEEAAFSTTAEVWVGVDDDVVRRLRLVSEGSIRGPAIAEDHVSGSVSSEWRTETTVRLSDFGVPVEVESPPAAEVTGEAPAPRSFAVLYPFGGHVALHTSADGSP